MKKVLILVEGLTEETVVRDLIDPHLWEREICLEPVILKTKREKSGKTFKGGIGSFEQVSRDLKLLLGDTSAIAVTTLLDYYRLPSDFPGTDDRPTRDPYKRVAHVERAFEKAIDHRKFVPHLTLHELEAWVYVDPFLSEWVFGDPKISKKLIEIRNQCGGPELVDEGPATAPSKRILAVAPEYEKPFHGPLAIGEVGIDRVRAACTHANAWLAKLESL